MVIKIVNCFSQERDKLIFELKKSTEYKYLEISVNPGLSYITIKQNFHRAKKNTIDLFSEYLPTDEISFHIAESDRILKIKTSEFEIYFTIRGKFTNLFFIQDKQIKTTFKNIVEESTESLLEELLSTKYISEFNNLEIEINDDGEYQNQLKTKYPFVGKEILNEIKFRLNSFNNENDIQTSVTAKDILQKYTFRNRT